MERNGLQRPYDEFSVIRRIVERQSLSETTIMRIFNIVIDQLFLLYQEIKGGYPSHNMSQLIIFTLSRLAEKISPEQRRNGQILPILRKFYQEKVVRYGGEREMSVRVAILMACDVFGFEYERDIKN